jgi:hypothetical protein
VQPNHSRFQPGEIPDHFSGKFIQPKPCIKEEKKMEYFEPSYLMILNVGKIYIKDGRKKTN